MKKPQKILLLILLITILIGLGFFFFSQKKVSPEDQSFLLINPFFLNWETATSSASWLPRDSHAAVVFKNKIWLMGGLNGNGFQNKNGNVSYWLAPHFSDVWSSEDGKNWELVTGNAPWGKRRSMQVEVFKNKLWLVGGWSPQTGYSSDIWVSADGANWEKIVPQGKLPAVEGHQLVVFKNKLWLIGGVRYDQREEKNYIWFSEDGVNWVEAASATPWLPRWDHTVTVFKDKLWLTGGMDLNGKTYQDVWNSEDGKNWNLVTDHPPWQARQGHLAVVFQDRLWIIGRFNDSEEGGDNDVWYSDDGNLWEKTKENPVWAGREDSAAIVFKDKIWILGGMDTGWNWRNDIWHSVFYTNLEPTEETLAYPFKASLWEKLLASVSQVFKTGPKKKVSVSLSEQKMRLFENYELVDKFPVSTGCRETPTPAGNFKIYNKSYLIYSKIANCWLPYWVGFSTDGLYGFHQIPICREGRRGLEKLGEPASIGCVRLGIKNSRTFYNWVEIGTPIVIY